MNRQNAIKTVLALGVMLLAGLGCSSDPPRVNEGRWSFEAPNGDVVNVDVTNLKKNKYYLRAPRHPISGVYVRRGDLLRIATPDNPRMSGYVFRVESDQSMVLIEETPVALAGQKLISGHLRRVK